MPWRMHRRFSGKPALGCIHKFERNWCGIILNFRTTISEMKIIIFPMKFSRRHREHHYKFPKTKKKKTTRKSLQCRCQPKNCAKKKNQRISFCARFEACGGTSCTHKRQSWRSVCPSESDSEAHFNRCILHAYYGLAAITNSTNHNTKKELKTIQQQHQWIIREKIATTTTSALNLPIKTNGHIVFLVLVRGIIGTIAGRVSFGRWQSHGMLLHRLLIANYVINTIIDSSGSGGRTSHIRQCRQRRTTECMHVIVVCVVVVGMSIVAGPIIGRRRCRWGGCCSGGSGTAIRRICPYDAAQVESCFAQRKKENETNC